jgi:hypothetical protein
VEAEPAAQAEPASPAPEPVEPAPLAAAPTASPDLLPPPETLTAAEIWSEVAALQGRVHEYVTSSSRKTVEGMTELKHDVDRMSRLVQALEGRLEISDENERVRVERLIRPVLIALGQLYSAAESLIPGQLAVPMYEAHSWLVTLEDGLPREQIGDAHVREREAVDWNKIR